MLKKIMILGTALMMCLAFASCDGDSSGDNGYSPEYNKDAEYRSNVNKAADAWGKDAGDVDRTYHALAGDD